MSLEASLFLLSLLLGALAFLLGVWPSFLSAFEVKRQTSEAARRGKSLPPISAGLRARMAVSVFFGKHADNYDAVPVALDGCTVEIDFRLAGLIARLNRAGVPTVASCQGWHTETDSVTSKRTGLHAAQGAFLMVASHYTFPEEIMEAVVRSRSRLQIGSQKICVSAAYCYSTELFAANEVFIQLLDDWSRGDVDRSGVRYVGAALGFAG